MRLDRSLGPPTEELWSQSGKLERHTNSAIPISRVHAARRVLFNIRADEQQVSIGGTGYQMDRLAMLVHV